METGQTLMATEEQNKAQSNNIKLSIQVSLSGLSFCSLNRDAKVIEFFKDVRFRRKMNPVETLAQIEKVYSEEKYLDLKPSDVEILFSNELYSILPEKFFTEENASDFLKFNTRILENDFVAHDQLPEQKLVNVYIPFTNINNFFFDLYGEFNYRHCVSVLVEEFMEQNKDQADGDKVYLNRNSSGYDLLVIQKGQLLFSNSFHCETKEDFIYYLLFTAEQLELDPQEFELILLGNITQNSDYYDIAYTYIRKISFLETSFGYIFDAGNAPPKGYRFFSLLKSLE
ncbi:MAG TPA: DUF3822 family protein [Salinimicrobium sp.]|nr:DUF3822 family protein [Salinimicrobium sp.]